MTDCRYWWCGPDADYYIIHDSDKNIRVDSGRPTDIHELWTLNEAGYGVFFSVNKFKNGVRRVDQLEKIRYWFVDLDGSAKERQMEEIQSCPLIPTMIVETKHGYHVYWAVEGDCTLEQFTEIEKRLWYYFKEVGADKACKDVTRLLRAPLYYHMKDPAHPFKIQCIQRYEIEYTVEDMLESFKPIPEYKPKYERREYTVDENLEYCTKPENWEKVYHLSRIRKGCRHTEMVNQSYKAYMQGFRGEALRAHVLNLNAAISEPLPEREVLDMLKSLR